VAARAKEDDARFVVASTDDVARSLFFGAMEQKTWRKLMMMRWAKAEENLQHGHSSWMEEENWR
jgi:hypothetical protein